MPRETAFFARTPPVSTKNTEGSNFNERNQNHQPPVHRRHCGQYRTCRIQAVRRYRGALRSHGVRRRAFPVGRVRNARGLHRRAHLEKSAGSGSPLRARQARMRRVDDTRHDTAGDWLRHRSQRREADSRRSLRAARRAVGDSACGGGRVDSLEGCSGTLGTTRRS